MKKYYLMTSSGDDDQSIPIGLAYVLDDFNYTLYEIEELLKGEDTCFFDMQIKSVSASRSKGLIISSDEGLDPNALCDLQHNELNWPLMSEKMALIITAQNDAKLIISGTTTELPSIYSRIESSNYSFNSTN